MSYRSRVRGLLRHAAIEGDPTLDAPIAKLLEYAHHFVAAEGDPLLEPEAKRLLIDAAYNLSLTARDMKRDPRPRTTSPQAKDGADGE